MRSSPPDGGSALDPDTSEILAAIRAAADEVLEAVRRRREPTHEEIDDPDLSDVIARLEGQVFTLVGQAQEKASVELRLDDLFDVVIALTERAVNVEAVDLEISRWVNDRRAETYFDHNFLALQRGATIRRVYLIGPHVTEAMMDSIRETLARHLACNHDEQVRKHRGHLDIGVIYHEDAPRRTAPRDFAIFDEDKVLFEEFDTNWSSTLKGQLTKDPTELKRHTNYFEELWDRAEKLGSADDVTRWAERTRERIWRKGFKYDVFFGYSNLAATTALHVKDFVTSRGYTVNDWKEFPPGPELLNEIARACEECVLGLFLFTKDDLRPDAEPTPRDNVVFEAGFFLSAKGDERVVIVVEEGAKRPTDLEGNIWIPLPDRNDVTTIHTKLLTWLEAQLGLPASKRR